MDMAQIISPQRKVRLNQLISKLEAKNGSEIVVVTVPETTPSPTPKAFATELFKTWGIGKKGKDNGVLFLISKGDRRVEIETGYGVEAILPDALVANIIDQEIIPQFKRGNFDRGILAGTESLVSKLGGNLAFATANTAHSSYQQTKLNPVVIPLAFLLVFLILVFIVLAASSSSRRRPYSSSSSGGGSDSSGGDIGGSSFGGGDSYGGDIGDSSFGGGDSGDGGAGGDW